VIHFVLDIHIDNDGKKPAAVEQLALDVFNKRNNMHAFLEKMKQDAHVYGDGICLIVYTNDQKNSNTGYLTQTYAEGNTI